MAPLLTTLFLTASTQFGLPSGLLEALCYVESRHDVEAVHQDDGGSKSLGVCQVKLKTAQWMGFRGTEEQLMDPIVNVYYAAKYLSYNIKRYHNNVVKGIISYNRGNAKGLYSSKYSNKVIKKWKERQ